MSAIVGRPPRPPLERFSGFVAPEPNTGCWLWLSTHDRDGYAMFFWGRGKTQRAHRFAYETFGGPIPEGLVLDHLCRTPVCVNPLHLEPVTNRENVLRGRFPYFDRTHCSRGHELNEANTYRVLGRGGRGRKCRRCHADQERARRESRSVAA